MRRTLIVLVLALSLSLLFSEAERLKFHSAGGIHTTFMSGWDNGLYKTLEGCYDHTFPVNFKLCFSFIKEYENIILEPGLSYQTMSFGFVTEYDASVSDDGAAPFKEDTSLSSFDLFIKLKKISS